MFRSTPHTLAAAALLATTLAIVGCEAQPVRAFVAGHDGAQPEQRAQLREFEQANKLQLVWNLDAEELDYIVLTPLPEDQRRAREAEIEEEVEPEVDNAERREEVLDRMHWFAMLDAHERAQTTARERGIPLVDLPRFLEMLEADEVERRD